MSETTTAAASSPGSATSTRAPGSKAPQKTHLGLTNKQWLIAGGIGVAALAYFLWRKYQAAQQAAANNAATTNTSSECTDDNGNSVPCDSDDSGELSALQTELESLMAAGANQGGGGGGYWELPTDTGNSSTTGTTSTTTTPSSGGSTSTGTSTSSTPTTSSGSTTTAKKATTLPAPTGVRSEKTTATSVTLTWTGVPGATAYRVRVTYQSQLVTQQTVYHAIATISGLTPDHTYGFHVATINSAGTGPEGDTDIKTPKS